MLTKRELIKQALKNVFEKLTANESVFTELFGFKTAEISVCDLSKKVGIGYYEPGSILKIFFVDDDYKNTDSERFKPVFSISYTVLELRNEIAWNIEFINKTILVKEAGDLSGISSIMQAVYCIIQSIEYEEKKLFKNSLC
jgi:hypothetical protein